MPYTSILMILSAPFILLMCSYMHELPKGSSVKLNYALWPWENGKGEIHQTTYSLIRQRLSVSPIFKYCLTSKNHFSISRSILREASSLTVDALNIGGFKSIKMKSHLLNHTGAADKLKNAVLSMNPQLTCVESKETLDLSSRCLIAWATRQKLKDIPCVVKSLMFELA